MSSDSDRKAAHELLCELRTRVTTQPLPYQYGVETRALQSLVDIFGLARDAMKKYEGCAEFARLATNMLNQDLRPVTAKWHRGLVEGRLDSKDGADEFRVDLERARLRLQDFAKDLQKLAYGAVVEDAETPPPISVAELDQLFAPTPFGIATGALTNDAEKEMQPRFAAINGDEARAVHHRRVTLGLKLKTKSPDDDRYNAVGLALSGGGIRSASFCLGVVQVIANRGLLRDVDFLSTVSGGGYTGCFLSTQLGDSPLTQSAAALVGSPYGPDPEPVAALRAHAKYLTSANLRVSWSRVTATLAGMLLNWAGPLLALVVPAVLLGFLGLHQLPPCFWQPAFLGSSGLVVIALIGYCIFMRCGAKAASWAGGVLAVACLVLVAVGALYVLDWGHTEMPNWKLNLHWRALSFAAVASAGPVVVRFVPVLQKPAVRVAVLKVLLAIAAVFIPILAVLVFFALWNFGLACSPGPSVPFIDLHRCLYTQWPGWCPLVLLAAVLGLITGLLDVNLTSPHRLYRDALAKTFITKDSLLLGELGGHGPYHLLNATVNLPNSENSSLRERRGDFFLFSKHWSGSVATGYFKTPHWKSNGEPLELKTAMAISGAAASSHMGLISITPLVALLTFLNVRLGFWLKEPRYAHGSAEPVPDKRRAGAWCLLREMFGFQMSEKGPWLNLSDGGHLENSGIYELLRRRCKFIVAVDAEADESYGFGGLLTVVRHSQIDLGIRIEPRLEPLRPNPKTGYSARHTLLCKVHYPAAGNLPAATGFLLYLKASLTGNESALIQRYRANHPEFPHESTLDQFFDQEQFEAYRELGVHVADGLFTSGMVGANEPRSIETWFRRLANNLLEHEQA